MTRPPDKAALGRRTRVALEQTRAGRQVVIVVDQLTHVGHIMTELELNRRVPGEVLIRGAGRQGLDHTRSGGRLWFVPAANPKALRGHSVDLILVDPRVATTTELEHEMQLACMDSDQQHAIVRPGDGVTIGQLAAQ